MATPLPIELMNTRDWKEFMVKKLRKITIFKRLRHFWFGKFVVRYYRIIYRIVWKVTRVIYAKTSEAVFLVLFLKASPGLAGVGIAKAFNKQTNKLRI